MKINTRGIVAILSVSGTLAPCAFAQEGTLTQDQLLTMTSPFGNGTISSVSASGSGVLLAGSLGDESGDFSRLVVGADFFGSPLDFSSFDSIAVKVRVTERNVPFMSGKGFVQTPDGAGGFGFNEGSDTQLPLGQTTLVTVPLGSVANTDMLSRWGIQFFGPGPLFPGEEPVQIYFESTAPGTCSIADFAAPFGTLNFFDVSTFISVFNQGCQATGSVGVNPYSLSQAQLAEMNGLVGTLNSATPAGPGVDFNCTLADGGGFTQVSLAYGLPTPLDLSANDTIEFMVNLIAGDGFGCRIVVKDGPSFTYNAGEISNLAVGSPVIVSLDLSAVAMPNDIREFNIEFFGAAIGDLNSTEFDVNIRPVDPTCGPADLAAPFGALNFFDVSAFIAAFNAGCP
jgi:hypothetical protein